MSIFNQNINEDTAELVNLKANHALIVTAKNTYYYKYFGKKCDHSFIENLTIVNHSSGILEEEIYLDKITSCIFYLNRNLDIVSVINLFSKNKKRIFTIFIHEQNNIIANSNFENIIFVKYNDDFLNNEIYHQNKIHTISVCLTIFDSNINLINLKDKLKNTISINSQIFYNNEIKIYDDEALEHEFQQHQRKKNKFFSIIKKVVIIDFGINQNIFKYLKENGYDVYIYKPDYFISNYNQIRNITSTIIFSDSTQNPLYLFNKYNAIFPIIGNDIRSKYIMVGSMMIFIGLYFKYKIVYNGYNLTPYQYYFNSRKNKNAMKVLKKKIFSFFFLEDEKEESKITKDIGFLNKEHIIKLSSNKSILLTFDAKIKKNKNIKCGLDFNFMLENGLTI